MENRILGYIEKGLDKGENLFFGYGENIHDWYLYDIYKGVLDAAETYKEFFLNKMKYNYYMHCVKDGVYAYTIKNDAIIDVTNDLFAGRGTEGDDSDSLDIDNLGSNSEEQSYNKQAEEVAADTGNSLGTNQWIHMVDHCKNNPGEKIAIFCEDYDWTTGLYKSSNDDELMYIKYVKELASMKNVIIVVFIEDIEMLSKYHFELGRNNNVMIGSPSDDEVFYVYLRRYMRKYANNEALNGKFIISLKDIAQGVAAGDKSLKDTLRVFDRVMKKQHGILRKDDFESALDKIIEEKVTMDDVILDDGIKEKVNDRIERFLNQNIIAKSKGLILTGPPGTGKTYLVKAIANDNNCHFISPSLADLKGEFVGQTGQKVKRLFQQARANAPTILFIDEADTVFPARDLAGTGNSDSFNLDMVNQFLVEMDGLKTGEDPVFVIAATNRISVLDSAIRSRLGDPIEIPLPDMENRTRMFSKKLSTKGFFIENYNFMSEFIKKTNHMSGRDIDKFIKNLISKAESRGFKISEYKKEADAKDLFYETFAETEKALVNDLSLKLGIEIRKPGNSPKYSDIIGYENIKQEIDHQIDVFDSNKRVEMSTYGIKPKRGMLLYGPPGNAKSTLAEAAANEHNLYFIKVTSDTFKVNPDDLNSIIMDIFDSAMRLSEMCSEQKGVLLFFDEFDSIASSNLLDLRVRGTLLTQLDDKRTLRREDSHILFMAATNFYSQLDQAMIRTGRIDIKLEMKNPTNEDAEKMLQVFLKQNSKVDFSYGKVETKKMYEKFKKSIIESKKIELLNTYSKKVFFMQLDKKDIEKQIDETLSTISPSGSEIRAYSNALIEKAYRLGKITSKNMLYIDDAVINEVCNNMRNSVE